MEKEVLFGTFDAFLISQMGFSLSGTNIGTTGKNTERGVSYILEQNPGRTAGIISDHTPVVWHPKRRCACA